MLSVLDVIWVFDGCIVPPGFKMVVCVDPDEGLFFRINSKGKWQKPVAIAQADHSGFLNHDSFIECGEPIVLDEYVIEESMNDRGVLGSIDPKHAVEINVAVQGAFTINRNDKARIGAALDKLGGN